MASGSTCSVKFGGAAWSLDRVAALQAFGSGCGHHIVIVCPVAVAHIRRAVFHQANFARSQRARLKGRAAPSSAAASTGIISDHGLVWDVADEVRLVRFRACSVWCRSGGRSQAARA